jgi:molybdopterin-containing oxidoreductase family membrane subunit
MKKIHYTEIAGKDLGFWAVLGMLGLFIAIGLASVWHMEHEGHHVTGMSNQIIWGMPHIFAILLIVAASGALNIASIGTVFHKTAYKPLGRISAWMSICLLVGGLSILVLDLGRPDRLLVAMTTYNFKSVFAWNMILYNGFFLIVGVYLWFMMERKMNQYYPYAGLVAFVWRLILTTGTGSIFGFLVARDAYDTAVLAPLFVVLSFALGLALFVLFLMAVYKGTEREIGDGILNRLAKLLTVFVAAVFYFVLLYHGTNLYMSKQTGFENFILSDGGIYTTLFWFGYVFLGTVMPMALLNCPRPAGKRWSIAAASGLTVLGAFSLLYVIIIGGQAYPLEIFPGKEVIESGFMDMAIGGYYQYSPSQWEIMLGLMGVSIAILATLFGTKLLPFLPKSLADNVVDPHAK